jgi:hypothetical protein
LTSLLAAAGSFEPQVIVRETMEYASLIAAEKLEIPHARVGIVARGAELPMFSAATAATNLLRERLGLPSDPAGSAIASSPS